MRIPVNLASEPFSRNRSTIVVSGIIGIVLLLALGAQALLILSERGRAEENRNEVARLRGQLNEIQNRQNDANTFLVTNTALLEESYFLNTLIARKSISWAQLCADIESVLPNGVRVTQIRLPQMDKDNRVTLDLEVGAKTSGDANAFMDRLANSPLFGPARPIRYDPPTDDEPFWRYRLSVNYGQKSN